MALTAYSIVKLGQTTHTSIGARDLTRAERLTDPQRFVTRYWLSVPMHRDPVFGRCVPAFCRRVPAAGDDVNFVPTVHKTFGDFIGPGAAAHIGRVEILMYVKDLHKPVLPQSCGYLAVGLLIKRFRNSFR